MSIENRCTAKVPFAMPILTGTLSLNDRINSVALTANNNGVASTTNAQSENTVTVT